MQTSEEQGEHAIDQTDRPTDPPPLTDSSQRCVCVCLSLGNLRRAGAENSNSNSGEAVAF